MSETSVPMELKQFMDVNMHMVHTLEIYCKSALISQGPCDGCDIQATLKNLVGTLLANFNMNPCSFEFASRLRDIFNRLNIEEGFWTIRRISGGWSMLGAGFRLSHWPKHYKHDPVEIPFQAPCRKLSQQEPIALQFSCMKAIIDSMFRATGGKVNKNTVNSLNLPEALKNDILRAANEKWHLGVLIQNRNQDFQSSEYFGFWFTALWGDLPSPTTDVKFYLFA